MRQRAYTCSRKNNTSNKIPKGGKLTMEAYTPKGCVTHHEEVNIHKFSFLRVLPPNTFQRLVKRLF